MKMSTKGRYGLRLMVALAAHYDQGPLCVEPVSKEENISSNYIRVLMGGLKTAGLVRSIRGAKGGYELARDPSTITAFDVVSALEEDMIPVECVSEPCVCLRVDTCPTRHVWCEIAASVENILKGLTLQDLLERRKDDRKSWDYCI